jgi:hypothetical protein
VIYNVVFSLEAAAELVRIMGVLPAAEVLRAAQEIRQALESDPAHEGIALPEDLYYIDRAHLRAFFTIDFQEVTVEITDFRIV